MPLHPAKSSKLVAIATLALLGGAVVALSVLSVLVRYTDFITAHPVRFALEVIVVSIGSALPIYIAAHNRNSELHGATWHILALAGKLALFWVLMELSGVNSVLFPARAQMEGYYVAALPASVRGAASLLFPFYSDPPPA